MLEGLRCLLAPTLSNASPHVSRKQLTAHQPLCLPLPAPSATVVTAVFESYDCDKPQKIFLKFLHKYSLIFAHTFTVSGEPCSWFASGVVSLSVSHDRGQLSAGSRLIDCVSPHTSEIAFRRQVALFVPDESARVPTVRLHTSCLVSVAA